MGRSVATHPEALVTVFASDWEGDYDDYVRYYDDDPEDRLSEDDWYEYIAGDNWTNSLEWFVSSVMSRWPSFVSDEREAYREVHVVLSNELVEISVSEYCGLTALCIAPLSTAIDAGRVGLAAQFAQQMEERFTEMFGDVRLIGTASNGESFYERM